MRYVTKRLRELAEATGDRPYYRRIRRGTKNLTYDYRARLKRAGLTPAAYDALLIAQHHACALCDNPIKSAAPDPTRAGRGCAPGSARVWIAPRGPVLLCGSCRTAVAAVQLRIGVIDKMLDLCAK